jgi:2-oxoacid dehydrogenases acyltransferase (catalytic domain)
MLKCERRCERRCFTNMENLSHQVVQLPKMRRLASDIGWLVRNRYTIRGLLELDVTEPRRLIREHKARTGETLSFTAFLTKCVAQAVDDDKLVHAMFNWRGALVIFDDVDVGTLIEREADGKKYPLAHIVRGANKKTFREIHDEIRKVQSQPMSDKEADSLDLIVKLPRFVRRGMLWAISKSPRLRKQKTGTVGLSAIGMFGSRGGWATAPTLATLGVLVGGIVKKPGILNDHVETREYLSITLDFDHDIIDGAPAARFAQHLADLIESGDGLAQSKQPVKTNIPLKRVKNNGFQVGGSS